MSNSLDRLRTSTGLTLQEAELRIHNLEHAISQAILLLGALADVINTGELEPTLIRSVDLLSNELISDGIPHSELVGEELYSVLDAAHNLRETLQQQQQKETDLTRLQKGFNELLKILRDTAANATSASIQASEASRKSLLAVQKAAATAQVAIIKDATDIADIALETASTAAAAAKAAATAAMAAAAAKAAAGHNTAHSSTEEEAELVRLSEKASEASELAAEAAVDALKIFSEAYEAVNKAKAGK